MNEIEVFDGEWQLSVMYTYNQDCLYAIHKMLINAVHCPGLQFRLTANDNFI